jgi:glycerophosphoryl diester phosphodiesterase
VSGNTTSDWTYPRWVAHRGAGKLAPENTLAAFKLGASHGYTMFECDVKLSADGVPFLLHDDTLERTSNGAGVASDHPWQALQALDAGNWHSAAFTGERIPSLEEVAHYCITNGFDLNIEIKPTTGADQKTGEAVAQHAARLWQNAGRKPLLTSFKPDALQAALDAAPELPRGLLLHELWTGWLETALMLGCSAIVCNYRLWDTSSVTQAKSAGFKLLSYTVNDAPEAQRVLDLGIDGIITDRVDAFSPDA